ncbi:MAG: beta-glucosidase [Ruminococcaceae bacterium]|nr:beta-glucosidase [Oscillospiraceae bacterium]
MKKGMKRIISMVLVFSIVISALSLVFAVSGNIDPEIIKETSKTAVEIEAEGIVLLKNEDNVLPLDGKKVNVFGAGSVCPFIGSSSSGGVVSDDPVTFYDALDEAGIEYNESLRALYEKHCGSNALPKTKNTVINNGLAILLAKDSLEEMPDSKLNDKVMNEAKDFSDTAILVISRIGAEETDLDPNVLHLTDEEITLVEKLDKNFENVIVLFNIGNIMEMGWIDEYDSIKAAAIIWIPGEFGMTAVAQMLKGEVNPSGRLADTVAYKTADYPSSACFGNHEYTEDGTYIEYLEGIYVGYRYFETFAKDKVQFPFGYGLSYTTFEKELVEKTVTENEITVSVKVTNTGAVAGKDVVQVYYSAPYYEGGIEKSAINLIAFDKTEMLEPGKSETVTLTFEIDDMASYDHKVNEAWILEKGTYEIIIGENVREHIDSFEYVQAEDKIMKYDDVTGTEIENRFEDAYNGFPVLSRKAGTPTYPTFRQLDKADGLATADDFPLPQTEGEVPKTGVVYDEVITLQDVYEDESLWDKFLDQLTVEEMAELVADGGYGTRGIERLGIPATSDNDGPSSIKGRKGILFTDTATAYPSVAVMACTWNTELMTKLGEGVGVEARDMGTDIWYAPAVNLHRNPAGGRNYEYFSEDPVISGKMASAMITGCHNEGLAVTIKHFALNEQDTNRKGVCTWADEQTIRELYLKAFEIPIKETNCKGVMSSYNRIGTTWAGGNGALLNEVLRNEWGFEGFVVSDYSWNMTGTGYMNPVIAVYNGNDTILSGVWILNYPSHVSVIKKVYEQDPIGMGNALRQATKNLCIAKMSTRAFLDPQDYDDSLKGNLDDFSDWEWKFPYVFTFVEFILNNFFNIILWLAGKIC